MAYGISLALHHFLFPRSFPRVTICAPHWSWRPDHFPKLLNAGLPKHSGVLQVPSGITALKYETQSRAPPPSSAGRGLRPGCEGGKRAVPLGVRWPPSAALRSRPPGPAPAPRKAWHRALAPQGGRVPRTEAGVKAWKPLPASGQRPAERLGLLAVGEDWAADGVSTPDSLRPPGSRSSYLLGDQKPPVPPHPSPPPLAHGEPGLPSLPPLTEVLEPPAVSASPGESGGLRHGLHRTRRGGSHSSSGAQARSDRIHGARTAGRVAYYGGRFGLTSASLPPAPSSQTPDGAAAQAQRRPSPTCVCRGCIQHSALPNGSEHQVRGAGPR